MEQVSVIIPTYNRDYCIRKSIESVLNQSYGNLEVIVIDDGSLDRTGEIVEAIGDDRVIYRRNERNQGPSAARNRGIRLAGGDYIAFNDSDDIWRADKLEKQMQVMKKGYDLVFCRFRYMDGHGGRLCPSASFTGAGLEDDPFPLLLHSNPAGTPSVLLRKALAERAGGFDESLHSCEDWEFVVRMAKHGKLHFLDECLVDVYRQPGSVNNVELNALRQTEAILTIMEETREIRGGKGFVHDSLLAGIFISRWEYLNPAERETVTERVGRIFGINTDFLRHYICVLRERRKAQYYYSMMSLLCERKAAVDAAVFQLKRRDAAHVAVYGMGTLGRMLLDVLDDAGIATDFIVDRNMKTCKNIRTYTEENMPCRPDAFILTYYHEGNDYMYARMEERLGAPVIPLRQLLTKPEKGSAEGNE